MRKMAAGAVYTWDGLRNICLCNDAACQRRATPVWDAATGVRTRGPGRADRGCWRSYVSDKLARLVMLYAAQQDHGCTRARGCCSSTACPEHEHPCWWAGEGAAAPYAPQQAHCCHSPSPRQPPPPLPWQDSTRVPSQLCQGWRCCPQNTTWSFILSWLSKLLTHWGHAASLPAPKPE